MHNTLRPHLLVLTALLSTWPTVSPAADNGTGDRAKPAELAAVTAADDARVAAFTAPTREKMGAILSDDLRYAHSTGVVDTKSSLIDTLTAGKLKYVAIDYEMREFSFPAPGIALMHGRARFQAATAEAKMDNVLSFLGVWRNESGHWRFLAWQSCKVPPATKP